MTRFFSRPSPPEQPQIDLTRMRASVAPLPEHVLEAIKPAYDRVTPRMDTWCVGRIEMESGHVRECVLIDLSETGARIRFRTRGKLTGLVRLKASRYRIDRSARIVWKDMYDAGLEFVDVAAPPA